MSKATGIDFKQFFKPEVIKANADKKYSDQEVAHYYRRFWSECSKAGMRFNTCYIGNGLKDYYQYQQLWTNKTDCCDIKGNLAAFKTTSQDRGWKDRLRQAPLLAQAEAAMKEEQRADVEFATANAGEKVANAVSEPIKNNLIEGRFDAQG